jgi:membrane protein implicated in regulation of membrane protease activity
MGGKSMSHGCRKLPSWLLVIGIALAIAVHAALFLRLGTYVTTAGALVVAALVIVAKHLGLARWSRRKTQRSDDAAMHDDEASP